MIDLATVLGFVSGLLDLATWPLYWIWQKPWKVEADKTRKRAVIEEVSSNRVRYSYLPSQEQSDDTMEFLMSKSRGSIVDVLDWVCSKYPQRECIGSRQILGLVDGHFNGKEVKKISKSPKFDTITFSQFKTKTDNIATGMKTKYSLAKGDKVLIFANSRAEWMISSVGCTKAGAVITTLVPSMTNQALSHAINQICPKIVITEISLWGKLQDVFDSQDTKVGRPAILLFATDGQEVPANSVLLSHIEECGVSAPHSSPVALDPSDTAVIMYTSGTTSAAKGVELTHNQLIEAIAGYTHFAQLFSPLVGQPLRFLQFLPLSHIFALSVSYHVMVDGNCLLFGSPYTLTDASLLTPKGERGDLSVARPHYMIAIPLILQRLKDGIEKKIAERGPAFDTLFKFCMAYKKSWIDRGYSTPLIDALIFSKIKNVLGGSLSHVIVGGAPISADLQTFCRNVLCTVVVQGYGSTETSGVATCQDKESHETDSVGYPPINGSILLDSWEEGGYSVQDPTTPSGEILLCGPFVAKGYYQCPEENTAFQTLDGGQRIFRTGDIGRINLGTNSLSIVDRKSQLIKLQNGEYISLGRIECALQGVKYVEHACVLARPQKRGSVAVIVPNGAACQALPLWESQSKIQNGGPAAAVSVRKTVVSNPNCTLLLAKLKEELKDVLSRYEIPMAIAIVEGPWTPESGLVTGALKIKRKAIQKKYYEEVEHLFGSI